MSVCPWLPGIDHAAQSLGVDALPASHLLCHGKDTGVSAGVTLGGFNKSVVTWPGFAPSTI